MINTILRKNKKFISLLLVLSFLVAVPYVAEQYWATSAQDKKEEAEGNLKDVEDEMDDIKDKQEEVEGELKDVRKKLSNLIEKQKELETEINGTQDEITQTQAELEVARDDAQKQYEAMKLRIKFMYENSSHDSLWTAILEADGIADMLNRVEYVSTIYKSDRELTEQYKATVAQVEEKEDLLFVKMDELLMKQEAFLGQQLEIEEMVASLEDAQNEYAAQLASAKKQAEAYKKTIQEQEEIIRKEEEERRRKEEERRKREEEERRKREEEEKRKQEEANKKPSQTDKEDVSEGNVTGEMVVSYARQFVGNPYVWGGNSLTKGCDCSGFVHLIYKNFGYKLVRYSLSFLYEGVPVDIEDIQPGDIVVYARNSEGIAHVAIYAGNGKIIEAQSTKAGITDNRPLVNNRKILGVRRILSN